MTNQLGTLLRRLRKQAGLTQEQVAERSGVSVSTIRRLENGRSTDYRVGTVNLLADALDAGPEDRPLLAAAIARVQGQSPQRRLTRIPVAARPRSRPPAAGRTGGGGRAGRVRRDRDDRPGRCRRASPAGRGLSYGRRTSFPAA
ncbi:helix-turn-helix transcriptional regulator [Kitasatospora paracochleata]|uniref:helix-turn-helix transcriptional regulator n=1 Tax=Kitasatospora paracochleata TaxID=58354 RepID=UPI0020A466BD|nr:helix-turn-helix transcriptional regulator [Kitasatospora paracochleata]